MSGEFTRVTVAERIGLFDVDGSLEGNCREVAALLANDSVRIARRFWSHLASAPEVNAAFSEAEMDENVRKILPYLAAKYTDVRGQPWGDMVGGYVLEAQSTHVSLTALLSSIGAAAEEAHDILVEKLAGDPERLGRLGRCITQSTLLEADMFAAHFSLLQGRAERESRRAQGKGFTDDVVSAVERTASDSRMLRAQASEASASARGMLGKTSEVASAAEQSALAMRDAAETAAGLIRAIEDARREVELAGEVATRAGDQASDAARVSRALSGHVEAIESILGLIRDIAGQTNLLALNATIEAARAGDSGRGFAVVAQEVKSLAAQTARATDEITGKISAIQQSTRQTVDANGSIQKTVGDVQTSAERIREAMEIQARTVTMITAAVDETALAADSMSATIAAIRHDTETVASEIDSVESGFANVDDRLTRFRAATAEFVTGFAA